MPQRSASPPTSPSSAEAKEEKARKVIILGAAGRDFHNFIMRWRSDPTILVVAFTHAAQIPLAGNRKLPPCLAGPRYPQGIPIVPEDSLEELIAQTGATLVNLAYSDLSHNEVGNLAARCLAAGASFTMLSPPETQLVARKPVIAVLGTRTGVGKSACSMFVCKHLSGLKNPSNGEPLRVASIRSPMPYLDNLEDQVVQRFASLKDLRDARASFEEWEEYQPYIEAGHVIFAGIDYSQILEAAEREADVIIFDGGNNDFSFIKPDLNIVVADALRPSHVTSYYPGEVNARSADVWVMTKMQAAAWEWVVELRQAMKGLSPAAPRLRSEFLLTVDDAKQPAAAVGQRWEGRTALCIEDAPSVTHGGLKFGAASIWCEQQSVDIVNPAKYAVGGLAKALEQYPGLRCLPSTGYNDEQIEDLRQSILNAMESGEVDFVAVSTPVDLRSLLRLPEDLEIHRVRYNLHFLNNDGDVLRDLVSRAVGISAARD